MKKDPRIYLAQILERIDRILQYTSGGKEAFLSDPLIQDAVIRNLEVIGEATKRIPQEDKMRHPAIPWKGFAGLRDILIHQYEGVDLARIWLIVERDLSGLRNAIGSILPPLEDLEREIAGVDKTES